MFSQEEEAAALKLQSEKKAKVEDDGILELSEDGSFDTAAAAKVSYAAKAAAAAASAAPPAPPARVAVPVAAPAAVAAEGEEADLSAPMEVDSAKGIDFPETEEERERKLLEAEEDKTPPRKTCLLP